MSFLKHASNIGLWTIASRVGGFVREMLTAYYLGASAVVDALVLALKLPSFIRRLTAEGTVNTCFIPLFSQIVATKGEGNAKRFAASVLGLSLLFLLPVTLLFLIFSKTLLGSFFPGLLQTPERLEMATLYARIIFPFIIFISATALYGGVLNAFHRFSAFAASPFFGNLFIVSCVLLVLGLSSQSLSVFESGLVFAIAITLSGVVQLVVVLVGAWRSGNLFAPAWPQRSPQLTLFFKRLGPAALGSGMAQINLFVGLLIASLLPSGSISYLNYADRLVQLPLSVIGTAMGVALLPTLARALSENRKDEADRQQEKALTATLLLSSLIVMLLALTAPLIVFLTFKRGHFSQHDVLQTARALLFYAPGLPAYMMLKILASRFFSVGRITPPLIAGVAGLITDITFSFAFLNVLGHVSIALASSVAAWVNVGLLMFLLKRDATWNCPPSLWFLFSKLLALASVLTAGLSFALPAPHTSVLLLRGVLGTFLFVGGVRLFCWKEIGAVWYALLKRTGTQTTTLKKHL